MSLAEHQATNPDYDVWQGVELSTPTLDDDALYGGSWWRIGWEDGKGHGFWDASGNWVSAHVLIMAGATFRRKKERKKEFVIESAIHPAWSYSVDGEPCRIAAFLLGKGIKRARLVVEEWKK